MRIDRLDLTSFGPFTDASLDLSQGEYGLHLVYGPNEAGKSSALRALRYVFCGFPQKLSDDWLHSYDKLRVGAAFRGRDGSLLELARRKGSKNTYLKPDGTPLDDGDNRLARILGGEPPEEFVRRFAIDHADLLAGGKSVNEGGGSLGRALFAAGGGGLSAVGGVIKQLEAEAESLFKPRGQNPAINLRLGEIELTKKALRDASLPSSEYVKHDQALHEALARKGEVESQLNMAERERSRLQRLSDAVAPAAKRRAILGELEALADTPRLPPGFGFQLTSTLSVLPSSEKAAAEALQRVEELTAELASIDVPQPLLDRAGAIEDLHQRLGGLRKAASDGRKHEADRARAEDDARAAARELGILGDTVEFDTIAAGPLAAFRLTAAERAAVLDLADRRDGLRRDRDEAHKALDANSSRRARAAAKLAATGPERDTGALKKALKDARKHGDLDDQIDRDRDALCQAEERALADLARLGFWSGGLDAVEQVPLPATEAVDGFRDVFEALDRDEADRRREIDDLESQARHADSRLEALRLAGDIPTEETLAADRRARDDAWERLKVAKSWDATLAAAYEPTVRAADEAADRLRREAARAAERAGLVAERARLAAERADRLARLDRLASDRDAAQGRWVTLWAPSGVTDPAPPREMLAWLRRQAGIVTCARAVRESRGQLARLEERREAQKEALRKALPGMTDDEGSAAGLSLSDLTDRAQDALDAASAAASDRKRQRQDMEALDAERPGLERASADAETAWESWQSRWASAVARLGLPPDAPAAAARGVLDLAETLFERLEKAKSLRREVESAAREAERFASEVRALAASVAPDLVGGGTLSVAFDPESAAAALHLRLTKARAEKARRDGLAVQLDEWRQSAKTAKSEVERHRDSLAALRREARCESDDELSLVDLRDRRRQKLESDGEALDGELERLAAGVALPAFLDEVARADPDELAPRVARLRERVEGLKRELESANQAIGREETELARMKGGSDAADLKQHDEDLRAKVKSDAEQYARLRLALAVLRAGVERYRKKAQDPVLARAGAIFRRLTLGSFDDLRVDFDDRDDPHLRGVRPGGEGLGVSAMSLGTADQLYLALRLATLADYLDRHEPLPLVVDDVLIQFDNARAGATLEVLAELSARTQVLMFTHHEHVRDLAEARVPRGVLFTHELPARAAAWPGGENRVGRDPRSV